MECIPRYKDMSKKSQENYRRIIGDCLMKYDKISLVYNEIPVRKWSCYLSIILNVKIVV